MEKKVIVSTTNSADYFFYIPYIEKAWNAYGWDLVLMVTAETQEADYDHIKKYGTPMLDIRNSTTIRIVLPKVEGLREATIAQAGRLYAANYFNQPCLLMTSDLDLLPLKDYWHPKEQDITVFGYDLTWRSFYPMGYIAMNSDRWRKYMNCTGDTARDMERDAKETKIAFSDKWEEWWNFDWDLITKRLKPFEKDIKFIDRGQTNKGLAYGRIDRADWAGTQNQTEYIDAHCENISTQHQDKLPKFLEVFERFHGKL